MFDVRFIRFEVPSKVPIIARMTAMTAAAQAGPGKGVVEEPNDCIEIHSAGLL
ncbi:hypothetical protein M9X92_011088 [Pyricularia oryzae]|nr:hypothetical protein M9X92_011088 [Pyricularia oryzae]